jgi:hypothetical protein
LKLKKRESETGVLVGVEIVEIVRLLAELNAGSSSPELLDQKGVVLLHYLPYQLPGYRRHLSPFQGFSLLKLVDAGRSWRSKGFMLLFIFKP